MPAFDNPASIDDSAPLTKNAAPSTTSSATAISQKVRTGRPGTTICSTPVVLPLADRILTSTGSQVPDGRGYPAPP